MKKNGFVAPIVVLTVICFVVSALLGYINSITEPIITEANIKTAEESKKRFFLMQIRLQHMKVMICQMA